MSLSTLVRYGGAMAFACLFVNLVEGVEARRSENSPPNIVFILADDK